MTQIKSAYLAFMAVLLSMSINAAATPIQVEVNGMVEFNQIGSGFLGGVSPGDSVNMSFSLDSDTFVDSASFPTRGYAMDAFVLSFNGDAIGLQDPFPAGVTPYFVIRDNDPAVDGFFVSTNVDFPFGVPIDQTGLFSQFISNFLVTYTGDTLPSLDILDALGTYDFSGLTVFNWTVDDGPFQPLGIVFEQMTITAAAVAEPGILALIGIGLLGMGLARRRKNT